MDTHAALDPKASDLAALARLGGVDASPEHLASIEPAVSGFFTSVARLRELDLSGVEPAIVFRARQG